MSKTVLVQKPKLSSSDLFWRRRPSEEEVSRREGIERGQRLHEVLRGNPSVADLVRKTRQLIEAAKFSSPDVFLEAIARVFQEECDKNGIAQPSFDIIFELAGAAAEIYADENLSEPLPLTADGPDIGMGRYRDMLIAMCVKLQEPKRTTSAIVTAFLASFIAITKQLPDAALCRPDEDERPIEGRISIPLIELLSDVGHVIENAIEPFDSEEIRSLKLFDKFRRTLRTNRERISPKTPITPSEMEAADREIVHAFLRDTPYEAIFDTPVAFEIPQETRYGGMWCIAPPGRGKTTLLHTMVMGDLAEDASVILMDSKGDLIEPFTKLASIKDRLILVEPDPDHPIAINPLDIPKTNITHAVDLLEYLFGSLLEFKMTALQTTLFRSVLRMLVTVFPNPTLETFRDILTNGIDKYDAYIKQCTPDLQDFFYREFDEKIYADRRREVAQRLRLLLDNDAMRAMLLAPHTRFDVGNAMDEGKVIIINNSKARLGDAGSEFFGRFFIAQILAAAQQRTRRSQRKPVYIYIDECHNVISRDERIPTILDECRSQKIALILAHQRTEQIKSEDVLSALANCAIRYANSDDEARYLAPKLRTSQEFLQSLKRGEFAAYVRDFTTSAVRLRVPKTDFSKHGTLSLEEEAMLRARMSADYGPGPKATDQPAQHASTSIPAERTTPPASPQHESEESKTAPRPLTAGQRHAGGKEAGSEAAKEWE